MSAKGPVSRDTWSRHRKLQSIWKVWREKWCQINPDYLLHMESQNRDMHEIHIALGNLLLSFTSPKIFPKKMPHLSTLKACDLCLPPPVHTDRIAWTLFRSPSPASLISRCFLSLSWPKGPKNAKHLKTSGSYDLYSRLVGNIPFVPHEYDLHFTIRHGGTHSRAHMKSYHEICLLWCVCIYKNIYIHYIDTLLQYPCSIYNKFHSADGLNMTRRVAPSALLHTALANSSVG